MKTPLLQPIICGTDFSDQAQQAANVAGALAKRMGTRLSLVRGVDERGEIPPQYWPRLMDDDRTPLGAECARLRALGFDVESGLAGGALSDGVAFWAEKAKGRLIVVGSSGKGAAERWILGSISERIAETAAIPTLVVREAAPLEAWARGERPLKILVAADFTATSDAALRWVGEIRGVGPCEITLCFVDHAPNDLGQLGVLDAMGLVEDTPESQAKREHELRAKAAHWLGVKPIVMRVVPGSGSIDAQILQLARDVEAELIVVGTHQWHGLHRLRHASVSRRVLRGARTNVACIPSAPYPGGDTHLPTIRRVLVATDLSEQGNRAIRHAYGVVQAGGSVCVFHVLSRSEDLEQSLADLNQLIPGEAASRGISSEVKVMENGTDVSAAICEASDRFTADLICVGSHGRSALLNSVLGSVAYAVVSRSCRPVLIVQPAVR